MIRTRKSRHQQLRAPKSTSSAACSGKMAVKVIDSDSSFLTTSSKRNCQSRKSFTPPPVMMVNKNPGYDANSSWTPTPSSSLPKFNRPSCDLCQGTDYVNLRCHLLPPSAFAYIESYEAHLNARHSPKHPHNGTDRNQGFQNSPHRCSNNGRQTQTSSDRKTEMSQTATRPP